MKTTQSSKKLAASSKLNKFNKVLMIFLIVFVLAVVGVVSYKAYRDKKITDDRARFTQAEQDVDRVSAAIVAAVGQPAKFESKKYCSRPNKKFDDGPLSCSIIWQSFLPIDNTKDANVVKEKLTKTFAQTWQDSTFEDLGGSAVGESFQDLISSNEYVPDDSGRLHYSRLQQNGMNCGLNVAYYRTALPPYFNYKTEFLSEFTLSYTLACSDYAKAEYYPMI